MGKSDKKSGFQPIVNKKALFDYEILEKLEAGIVLTGGEVKSLRAGRASLKEAFVRVIGGELFLINMQINPYSFSRIEEEDPKRSRKLLVHKREVVQLQSKSEEKGLSLIPIKIYSFKNRFKLEVGLAKGRKQYQKKDLLKRRDIERDTQREMKDLR